MSDISRDDSQSDSSEEGSSDASRERSSSASSDQAVGLPILPNFLKHKMTKLYYLFFSDLTHYIKVEACKFFINIFYKVCAKDNM